MIAADPSSDVRVLRSWERAMSCAPAMRAPALLSELEAAAVEPSLLPSLTVGELDRALFATRAALFGDAFVATSACQFCGQGIEFDFRGTDVLPEAKSVQRRLSIAWGDIVIEACVPTVADLDAASAGRDQQDASRILLNRSILSLRRGAECIAADALCDDAVAAIEAALEAADPFAICDLEVCCPSCGAVSECAFDIASFLWREVERRAMQILRDVHVLAREYGWREADILAMPACRRRLYLEMAGA